MRQAWRQRRDWRCRHAPPRPALGAVSRPARLARQPGRGRWHCFPTRRYQTGPGAEASPPLPFLEPSAPRYRVALARGPVPDGAARGHLHLAVLARHEPNAVGLALGTISGLVNRSCVSVVAIGSKPARDRLSVERGIPPAGGMQLAATRLHVQPGLQRSGTARGRQPAVFHIGRVRCYVCKQTTGSDISRRGGRMSGHAPIRRKRP